MDRIDYWYWENIFTLDQIKELNSTIEDNFYGFEPESLGATTQGKKIKTATVKLIHYYHVKKFFKDFIDDYCSVIEKEFYYDVFPMRNSDVLNYNIYSSADSGKYDFHIDTASKPNLDLKLTMLINLSPEPFEGGQFEIFNNTNYEVEYLKKPGNVIMFKSHLNHRVLPVTKGERRTLTLFLHGPRFR